MMPIAASIKYGNESVDGKEIRAARKLICEKCNCSMEESSKLVENIMTKCQDNKGVCNYGIKNMKTNKFYKDCNIKTTEGKIDNLEISRKAKAFLKCKAVCAIHCALSFLNLGWSIYELTQTYKGFEQVKIYENRLKKIVATFNIHKKEIGVLPSDFREASEKIRTVLEKIKKDEQNLEDLITDILKSISEQDSRKNSSTLGLGISGVLGAVGIAGAILTSNGFALTYGISSIANLFSAIGHSTNIIWSIKIIEGYRKVLEEAREEKKKMKDEIDKIQVEIDKLINEMTTRIEEQPKFELSSSLSSISTKDYI
jgi:predicted transcriptional regulator